MKTNVQSFLLTVRPLHAGHAMHNRTMTGVYLHMWACRVVPVISYTVSVSRVYE